MSKTAEEIAADLLTAALISKQITLRSARADLKPGELVEAYKVILNGLRVLHPTEPPIPKGS